MKAALPFVAAAAALGVITACSSSGTRVGDSATRTVDAAQTPTWSADDTQFFLHGSMSSEVVPEHVLRAFVRVYPELFPSEDLSNLGMIPDPAFGWPVGFSRGRPAHLGRLPSVGLNCAACHVAEVESASGRRTRVLGVTSHFDAEAFFGALIVSTFRAENPEEMGRFLAEYLDQADPEPDAQRRSVRHERFLAAWKCQRADIEKAMASNPGGAHGAGPGGLQAISAADLQLTGVRLDDTDLTVLSVSMLKLFHNIRAALHIPDQPPTDVPPASGPGRNDAFGLLSAELFNSPQPYGPVKYGLVWNLEHRHWVHWDGNTRSPLGRNILASLGLGAPLVDGRAQLDMALIRRHTQLTEHIAPPAYPFAIDRAAAVRGQPLYAVHCASCHSGVENDTRLYSVEQLGTDPIRATVFTPRQAESFNSFLMKLRADGYQPSPEPGIRSTQKYWAPSMEGVWARSPYLHNGSVRTMHDLLEPPASRPASFHRGSRVFDEASMGYTDAGPYLLDTTKPGNSNSGHDYGTRLPADQKRDLIEYLKTL